MTDPTGDALRAFRDSVDRRKAEILAGGSPAEQFEAEQRKRHQYEIAVARANLTTALEDLRDGFDTVGAVDAIQHLFEVMAKGPK